MRCPYCDNPKTRVVDSRSAEDGNAIRRRRHCSGCGSRFTTFERRERAAVVVVKRNGEREPYDREKLSAGFYKACSKREVVPALIEKSIDEVEENIMQRQDREVSASEVGDMVMEQLRGIDEVAYMRFASVYKRFDNVGEFQKELGELIPGRPKDALEKHGERSGK